MCKIGHGAVRDIQGTQAGYRSYYGNDFRQILMQKTVHLNSRLRGLECLRPHQLGIGLLADEDIFHTETGRLVDRRHRKAFSAQYPRSVCKYSVEERMWDMVALVLIMRSNFSLTKITYLHP